MLLRSSPPWPSHWTKPQFLDSDETGCEKWPVPSETTILLRPELAGVSSIMENMAGLPKPPLPPSTKVKLSPVPATGGKMSVPGMGMGTFRGVAGALKTVYGAKKGTAAEEAVAA